MKIYQSKKCKPYLLPDAVYRQALWAVKDLPRMKERLHELENSVDSLPQVLYSGERKSGIGWISDPTGGRAGELVNLSMRIHAIEDALSEVPLQYRQGLLHKLAYGIPYNDSFHLNTWKRWQQVYIHQVAMRLNLY